jgi:hypothetical protein
VNVGAEIQATSRPRTTRANWHNWSFIVIALLALELSFVRSLEAGLSSGHLQQSIRYRIIAFPIVFSHLYYGRPYDYTAYKRLEIEFEDEKATLEEIEPTLRSIVNVNSYGTFYVLADDKGVVDFVRLAFLFFGIRTAGLFYMYFTILAVSLVCFAISYFKDCVTLALLVMYCLALLAIMPVFAAFPPGLNILDVHAFGILSILPALHVLLAATHSHPLGASLLIPTFVQALIITLVYHARASSIAYTILVLVSYPFIVCFSNSSPRNGDADSPRRAGRPARFAPLCLLLIAIAALPVYQRLAYNAAYFGDRATLRHVLYHTLLSGMQWNPLLRDRYALGTGDLGTADAVDTFLYRRGEHTTPELRHWARAGQNTVTTQLPFDWQKYESAARDLYFYIWRKQPLQSVMTYVYYHPLDIYTVFMSYARPPNEPQVETNALVQLGSSTGSYNPFAPGILLVAIVTGLLSVGSGAMFRPVHYVIACVLVAAALLVPLVFYAGGFVIVADLFVVVGFLIYTTIGYLVSFAGHRFFRSRWCTAT